MLPRWLLILIALVVTGGWAANLIVGAIWPDRANAFVNGLFAIVLGAAFTIRARTKKDPGPGPATELRRHVARLLDPGPTDGRDGDRDDERGESP